MTDPLKDFLPELEELATRMGEANLVNNINDALASGRAQIGVLLKDSLAVIQPLKEETLLVWVVVSRDINTLSKYRAYFDDMARKCGYKRIKFKTRRRGFKRLASKLGYRETRPSDGFFVFEKEV